MVEQWGVKWDGTVSVATCVTSAVVEGCASYYVSRALTSLQRPFEQVQCCHLLSSAITFCPCMKKLNI